MVDEHFEPAEVDQYRGFDLFEHYTQAGYLMLITSDETAIEMEPGDFVVKRSWMTGVVPYVHKRYRTGTGVSV